MNICVCFQILKSYDDVSASEWAEACCDLSALTYVKEILNPYDESALENALYLKDNYPGSSITAITLCNDQDNSYMYKSMFAVGIDEVICCHTEEDIRFNSRGVAEVLATKCQGADIVIMGSKASLSMSGLTPYYVANSLGYNVVPNVIDINSVNGATTVTTQVDGGSEQFPLATSTVYTMGNAVRSYMRVATLREKLLVKSKQAEELDVVVSDSQNVELSYTTRSRKCYMLEGQTEQDVAKYILMQCQEV